MTLRLLSETEECEEDKRAERQDPAAHLEGDEQLRVCTPDDSRQLTDEGKVEVCVVPAEPGVECAVYCIRVKLVDTEWDREDDFRDGEDHQSIVAADGERATGLDEFAELLVTFEERNQREY